MVVKVRSAFDCTGVLLRHAAFVSSCDDPHVAAELFGPFLRGTAAERLCVAYLDAEMRLIRMGICPAGTAAAVPLPLRRIVHDALATNAAAILLAHNHPGGTARPSRADCRNTRRFASLAAMLGLHLLDHLIFTESEVVSLRALSLM